MTKLITYAKFTIILETTEDNYNDYEHDLHDQSDEILESIRNSAETLVGQKYPMFLVRAGDED